MQFEKWCDISILNMIKETKKINSFGENRMLGKFINE